MNGEAFLRAPSQASVGLLGHYLRLAPPDRQQESGIALLAEIAAQGEPPLASGALRRLARAPSLAEALDAAAAEWLVSALLRTDAGSELPASVLELVAHPHQGEPDRGRDGQGARAVPLATACDTGGRAMQLYLLQQLRTRALGWVPGAARGRGRSDP